MDLMDLSQDPFGTHRPVLIELIKRTKGNIIEFGCGNSSTVLIRQLIGDQDRILVSLESNLEWFNKFKHLENSNHKLFYVDASNIDNEQTGETWINFIKATPFINDLKFDVCFIDQSPWTARTYCLEHFKDICPFIVVHDVDYFPGTGKWGKIINQISTQNKSLAKYEFDFSDKLAQFMVFYPPEIHFAGPTGPPTLLCSNIVDVCDFLKMTESIDYLKYY